MKKSLCFIIVFYVIFSLTACQTSSDIHTSQSHPLVDKIWSVAGQQDISADSLYAHILKSDAILLGETHDNVRHHQLQAQVIRLLVENQRTPGVAFEMLDQNQQDSIEQFQTGHKGLKNKNDAFARAINWENSGWPEWSYYRPVFHAAIDNNLPIIAANFDSELIRKVIKQGSQVLPSDYQVLVKKYQYSPALKKELEQEVLSAHCDMLPEKMLSPMLLGQQSRDLAMTRAMQSYLSSPAQTGRGIVLIAGSGHTRTDYGVPYYLQQEMPKLKIISIAFMEVSADKLKPEDYSEAWSAASEKDPPLPFDYVWFTPRAEREDQCEKMKKYMEKRK